MRQVARSAEYRASLDSERWRGLRRQVIARAGSRCALCSRGGSLDVHHMMGYRRLGQESARELLALCRECHDLVHGRGPLPENDHGGRMVLKVIAVGVGLAWCVLELARSVGWA